MNIYDKVEEVLTALDEVATAIGALTAFAHSGVLSPKGEWKGRLLALCPATILPRRTRWKPGKPALLKTNGARSSSCSATTTYRRRNWKRCSPRNLP